MTSQPPRGLTLSQIWALPVADGLSLTELVAIVEAEGVETCSVIKGARRYRLTDVEQSGTPAPAGPQVTEPLPPSLALSCAEMARYGVLSVAASLSAEEVEQLIDGLQPVGCRGLRGAPTFDPAAARRMAREVVAGWCLKPGHDR